MFILEIIISSTNYLKMKHIKKLSFLFLFLVFSQNFFAQLLTLNELETIISKPNWNDANSKLTNKNWEFSSSEEGASERFNTITWAYNKNEYGESLAWLALKSYEDKIAKIYYQITSKSAYTRILKDLESKSYTLQKSEVKNNEIVTTHQNSKYILEINIGNSDNDKNVYLVVLIKRYSIYDTENGKKFVYYDDNSKKKEYFLINGKLNGPYKRYHPNGKLKEESNYVDGLENGLYTEYNDKGTKIFECNMLNGLFEGKAIAYTDGKTSTITNYKNGELHGEVVEYFKYYIFDEKDEFNYKLIGEYDKGAKSGTWKLYNYENGGKYKLLNIMNYSNGLLHGYYQRNERDSLIFANYENGVLDGGYKVYQQEYTPLASLFIDVDTSELILLAKGNYINGKKEGLWKFNSSNSFSYCSYKNDMKSGPYFMRIDLYKEDGIPYNIFQEGLYHQDNREGRWIMYSVKDKLIRSFNYKHGLLDGEHVFYNEGDKIQEVKQFSKGVFIEMLVFDSIDSTPLKKFEFFDYADSSYKLKYSNYSEKGKTSKVYRVLQEENNNADFLEFFNLEIENQDIIYLEGEILKYDINDNLLIEGNMLKNDKIGIWTYYSPEQNVKYIVSYNDNPLSEKYYTYKGELFSGNFLFLNRDNNYEEHRKIKKGLRNGVTKFVDLTTGETIKKVKYKEGILK